MHDFRAVCGLGFVRVGFIVLIMSLASASILAYPTDPIVSTWPTMAVGAGDVLEVDKPFDRTLRGGQTHTYLLHAAAGEYARVIVDQRGIDVVVRLFAPDGSLITFIDSPNGSLGAEPVHVVADEAGIYKIEVSVFDKIATGRYEARLVERRPIKPVDRERLAARRAFDEAEKLVGENKQDSYAKAIEKYIESRSGYRAIGERTEEYTSLFGLGMAYEKTGEQQKALVTFSSALVLAQTLGDKYRQGRMVEYIAGVHKRIGDLEKGIQGQIEASKLFKAAGDRVKEVEMLDSLGGSYNILGEHELARDHFQRAMIIYRELGYRDAEAAMYRAIGYSFSLQFELGKALDWYKKALTVSEASGNKREEALNHALIGDEYARVGDKAKALSHIERAMLLTRSFANGSAEHGVTFNVGSAYYRLGEFDKALSYFEPPLQRFRTMGNKRSEAITLKRMAEALRGKGKLTEAKAALERSIELMEFVRDHSGGPEQRASFVSTLFIIYETYIDLLMRIHDTAPDAGHDLAALAFAERVRMRSLVELLARARVDVREGADPKLLEKERKADASVTAKLDELTSLLRGKYTDDQRAAAERELDQAKTELTAVEAEIRIANPRYASITAPQPLSVEDIRRKVLDDETVLLEYKLGEQQSFLWVVTRGGVRSYRLADEARIAEQVRIVYELMAKRRAAAASADTEYWTQAEKLSGMILGPAAAQLGSKRLVVVADGALQYIPFAALPVPSLIAKNQNRPLMLDHEIVSLPSASVLDVLRREYSQRSPAPRTAAVLADPVYTTDDARVTRSASRPVNGARSGGFKRLLFSRGEAETILSVTQSATNLLAVDFEPDRRLAMSPELGKYRLLHFSTHGVLDSRRPELSGLVLSQVAKSGEPQEGLLRLHEIYNLRLNADLVVLSACQTGLGREVRGEGLIGLTRGFMYAGSPRVVASLWQVDDAATSALMKEFYRGMLVKKLTPAAALRAAQIEMTKRNAWRSPYYWGAFVLQGEWK